MKNELKVRKDAHKNAKTTAVHVDRKKRWKNGYQKHKPQFL